MKEKINPAGSARAALVHNSSILGIFSKETGAPERKIAMLIRQGFHNRTQSRIVDRSKEFNWRLYDLKHYHHKLPVDFHPDAVITDLLWDTSLVQQCQAKGYPILRLGHFPHPMDSIYPAIVPDFSAIARMAVEHFSERNFRHLGFVAWDETFHLKHLYEPFRQRAIELGCEPHLLNLRPLPAEMNALSTAEKSSIRDQEISSWLQAVPKPIGILGFYEGMAARICCRGIEADIDIPAQVGIISCGENRMVCECTPIQISAIPTSGLEAGDAAIELLLRLMDGQPAPDATVFVAPKRIIVRESTDLLACHAPEVALGLHFIWSNLGKSLSVEDVADAINTPRRKLERAFRKDLGRGVNAELRRRRLEYCCELLTSTDLPVTDIIPKLGFSSTAYLHKVFRKKFGMTPLQWRNQYKHEAAVSTRIR